MVTYCNIYIFISNNEFGEIGIPVCITRASLGMATFTEFRLSLTYYLCLLTELNDNIITMKKNWISIKKHTHN